MDEALIVVDIQNDFLPGGALAVSCGDDIIEPVNRLMERFSCVVLTQDFHPECHVSFASTHAGKKPLDLVDVPYGQQMLWPDHCVAGSRGAEFAPALNTARATAIVRKGCRASVDSYSGFLEADRKTATGLSGFLSSQGVRRVYVCGLATDFCVSWTALDAVRFGFECSVIEEAARAIDTGGSLVHAKDAWQKAGVHTVAIADLLA